MTFEILVPVKSCQQAARISAEPFGFVRFDWKHSISVTAELGMEQDQALEEWSRNASHIALWRETFTECGVMNGDIDYLPKFLDNDYMKEHRIDAFKSSVMTIPDDDNPGWHS